MKYGRLQNVTSTILILIFYTRLILFQNSNSLLNGQNTRNYIFGFLHYPSQFIRSCFLWGDSIFSKSLHRELCDLIKSKWVCFNLDTHWVYRNLIDFSLPIRRWSIWRFSSRSHKILRLQLSLPREENLLQREDDELSYMWLKNWVCIFSFLKFEHNKLMQTSIK